MATCLYINIKAEILFARFDLYANSYRGGWLVEYVDLQLR